MREAHLRDFIAVAEAGSVRLAARRLEISQGAVSKNLAALERELGVSLLLRSTRGVEPTQYGRVLLRRARLAALELGKAVEEIEALTGHGQGTVRIGLSTSAEALLGAKLVLAYRQRNPDSTVHVRGGTASTLLGLLREGSVDLAVTGVAAPGPDLHIERLFSTNFVVVARAGHPKAHVTDIRELADCEWIQVARPGELDPFVAATFKRAGLPLPRFAVQRDTFSAMLFLLQQTDFVAVASEPTVERLCELGMLARIPLSRWREVSVQSLVRMANRPLSPRAAGVATEIKRLSRALRR